MSWQYCSSKDFPKIFTEKSFFFLLDIKKKEFLQIVSEKTTHYRKWKKVKSDGVRYREIYNPDRKLKYLLKKLSKKYLSKFNYPPFAHCGPKGRSIITACRGHERFMHHVSLDIESFFDRVSKLVVERTLLAVGVNKTIGKLIVDISVEDNRLPQGFPTSSLLSALVVSLALRDFYTEFESKKLQLSLYADDILISSNNKQLLINAEQYIAEKLEAIHLSLNSDKKTEGMGTKFLWLSLRIHPKITLPRKNLRDLQKSVYTHKTTGIIPKDFKPRKKGDLEKQWKLSVKGKIDFAQSVGKNKLLEKISRDSQK